MMILIADPRPEVQSALRLLLEQCPEHFQVETTGSLVQLLARCAQACPELLLVDRDLAGFSRSEPHSLRSLVAVLRRLCARSQVVVLSSRTEAETEALAAGADGFISKTDLPDVVLARIETFVKNHS